jgi:hypothetical protein
MTVKLARNLHTIGDELFETPWRFAIVPIVFSILLSLAHC